MATKKVHLDVAVPPVSVILADNNWILPGQALSGDEAKCLKLRYLKFHTGSAPNASVDEDELDAMILALATQPRCRLPDLPPPARMLDALGAEKDTSCKWPHLDVRFWNDLAFSNVPAEVIQEKWRKAVESWAKPSGLRPVHVATMAQANVFAHAKKIDGASNVLAWSELPCGASAATQLEQRYDLEPWNQYGSNYDGLQEVMAHEIGHALGLDHSAAGNLMAPYATFRTIVPQPGDIAEIQARYGPPSPAVPPADPGAPGAPPTGTTTIQGWWTMDHPNDGRRHRLVLLDDGPIDGPR